MNLLRLFNEQEGKEYLADLGVSAAFLESLPLIGISGIGNLLVSIKLARYYELPENGVVL
jgi:hypothetical protein